jgi:hypothetical protein
VDTGGLEGFGQAHRRHDGSEPPRYPHGQDPSLMGAAQFHRTVSYPQ